jgi:hypothetical protein
LRECVEYRSVHDERRNRQVPGPEWYVRVPSLAPTHPGALEASRPNSTSLERMCAGRGSRSGFGP